MSWVANPFPFGSEFSWDSTGQEETYIWGRYFGQIDPLRESGGAKTAAVRGLAAADALANLTLAAVLAYMPSGAPSLPSLPHPAAPPHA